MPDYIFEFSDSIEETAWTTAHHGADPAAFYTKVGRCPSCQQQAPTVYSDSRDYVDGADSASSRYYGVTVYQCSCGWWDMRSSKSTGSDSTDGWMEWLTYTHGILKRFDTSRLEVPITLLRQVLPNRPEIIDRIHSRKMEELVGSIFADFFSGCEVHHCGRSHDGGIDLVLVLCDSPVAIQIKRRIQHKKGEPVSAVREFLGAMLVQGFSRGIYVTTADRFSKRAEFEVSQVLRHDDVSTLELIDRKSFFSMLTVVRPSVTTSWKHYLPNEFRNAI